MGAALPDHGPQSTERAGAQPRHPGLEAELLQEPPAPKPARVKPRCNGALLCGHSLRLFFLLCGFGPKYGGEHTRGALGPVVHAVAPKARPSRRLRSSPSSLFLFLHPPLSSPSLFLSPLLPAQCDSFTNPELNFFLPKPSGLLPLLPKVSKTPQLRCKSSLFQP